MPPRFSLLAAIGFTLAACGGSGFDGDTGDSADEGAALASDVYFGMQLTTQDGCQLFPGESVFLDLANLEVSGGGKKLKYRDDTKCKRDGDDRYRCEQHFDLFADELDFDAKIQLQQTSPGILDGTFTAEVTCNKGCDELPEFPCQTSGLFALTRGMPKDFVADAGDYEVTVGAPVASTCKTAPSVAAMQRVRVEAGDGATAQVFADDDPVPHECELSEHGGISCQRTTQSGSLEQRAQISAAWTSATTFRGIANVDVSCAAEDCAGSKPGELPCAAQYVIEGRAASASK